MNQNLYREKMEDRKVVYTLLKDGELFVVENVPARVNVETGEEYFSPQTVEKLQRIILGNLQPKRFIRTPVFDFQ